VRLPIQALPARQTRSAVNNKVPHTMTNTSARQLPTQKKKKKKNKK